MSKTTRLPKAHLTIRWLLIAVAIIAALLAFRARTEFDRKQVIQRLTGQGALLYYSWQQPTLESRTDTMTYHKRVRSPDGNYVTKSGRYNPQTRVVFDESAIAPTATLVDWIRGTHLEKLHTISIPASAINETTIESFKKIPELKNLVLSKGDFSAEQAMARLEEMRALLPQVTVVPIFPKFEVGVAY